MEEVKEVHTEGCSHTCVDLHKFCPKNCCLTKCLLVVIVLAGVFAAGFMSGSEGEGRDGHEGYGKNNSYQARDMMGGNDGENEAGGWNDAPNNSNDVQVIYRTAPATQQTTASATPQK